MRRRESVKILNMPVNPYGSGWPSRCGSPVFNLLYAGFTPPARRQHRDNSLHVITTPRFSGGRFLLSRHQPTCCRWEKELQQIVCLDHQTPEM